MTVGDFMNLLRGAVGRGASLDAVLPKYVALALLWLERNYEFVYMEQLGLVEVKSGDRVIEFPKARVRSFRFVRLVTETTTYLKQITPEQLDNAGTGTPARFYRVGYNKIVLDNVPDADLAGEAFYYQFTDWSEDLEAAPTILQIGSDVLLYQTILSLSGTVLRNKDLFTEIKTLRDEALNTLTRSEDELRYQGRDLQMAYVPQHSR